MSYCYCRNIKDGNSPQQGKREVGVACPVSSFLPPLYSHTIVSNQTKKAFIYSRYLLSHLWTRKAKALQVWTKEDSNGMVELCRVQLHPPRENSIYFYFLRGSVGWGVVKCKHHQTLGRTKHYLHVSPTTRDICTYHCCTSFVITLC